MVFWFSTTLKLSGYFGMVEKTLNLLKSHPQSTSVASIMPILALEHYSMRKGMVMSLYWTSCGENQVSHVKSWVQAVHLWVVVLGLHSVCKGTCCCMALVTFAAEAKSIYWNNSLPDTNKWGFQIAFVLNLDLVMPRCACAAKAYGSLLVFLSVILSVTGIAAQRMQFKCWNMHKWVQSHVFSDLNWLDFWDKAWFSMYS